MQLFVVADFAGLFTQTQTERILYSLSWRVRVLHDFSSLKFLSFQLDHKLLPCPTWRHVLMALSYITFVDWKKIRFPINEKSFFFPCDFFYYLSFFFFQKKKPHLFSWPLNSLGSHREQEITSFHFVPPNCFMWFIYISFAQPKNLLLLLL